MGAGKETDGDGNTTVNKQDIRTSCHKIKVCQIVTEKYLGRGRLHRHRRVSPGITLRNMLQWYVTVAGSTCQVLALSSVLFNFSLRNQCVCVRACAVCGMCMLAYVYRLTDNNINNNH